jgi:hypothetical protein
MVAHEWRINLAWDALQATRNKAHKLHPSGMLACTLRRLGKFLHPKEPAQKFPTSLQAQGLLSGTNIRVSKEKELMVTIINMPKRSEA